MLALTLVFFNTLLPVKDETSAALLSVVPGGAPGVGAWASALDMYAVLARREKLEISTVSDIY